MSTMHRWTRCLVVIKESGLFHLVYGLDKNLSDRSTEIVGAQRVFNTVRVCI